MIGFLVKLLGGGIADQLRRAYEAKLAAANDAERIAADVTIAQLQARQASLAAGGLLSATVQFLWAAPFIVYNGKLILWDKVLGWGVTDPLSPHLYTIETTIIGFYFAGVIVRGIMR